MCNANREISKVKRRCTSRAPKVCGVHMAGRAEPTVARLPPETASTTIIYWLFTKLLRFPASTAGVPASSDTTATSNSSSSSRKMMGKHFSRFHSSTQWRRCRTAGCSVADVEFVKQPQPRGRRRLEAEVLVCRAPRTRQQQNR